MRQVKAGQGLPGLCGQSQTPGIGAQGARAPGGVVASQPLTGGAGWAPVSCSNPEIKGSSLSSPSGVTCTAPVPRYKVSRMHTC